MSSVLLDWYPRAAEHLLMGRFIWNTDTIKASLHSHLYRPNPNNDDFFNDATNEVVGTGYSAGGVTLSSKTTVFSNGPPRQVAIGAAPISWVSLTVTSIAWIVIYKSTGTASTSPLIGYGALDTVYSPLTQTLRVTWASAGMLILRL